MPSVTVRSCRSHGKKVGHPPLWVRFIVATHILLFLNVNLWGSPSVNWFINCVYFLCSPPNWGLNVVVDSEKLVELSKPHSGASAAGA